MKRKTVKTYTEVTLAETSFEKSYKNPLTKTFQYEYALFKTLSDLFAKVECRSMSIESMKMYFKELPLKSNEDNENEYLKDVRSDDKNINTTKDAGKKPPKVSQEKILEVMKSMVARDVIGKITFPMMDKCAAEASTILQEDGSHWLVFTDGIYGFAVKLEMNKKKPHKLIVRDLSATSVLTEKPGEYEDKQRDNMPQNVA